MSDTYAEYRERAESSKPLFLFWDNGKKTFSEVATEFNLPNAAVAASKIRCYENFSKRPKLADWMDKVSMHRIARLEDTYKEGELAKPLSELRPILIEKFRKDPDGKIHKYPADADQFLLEIMMQGSGLRWYKQDGKCYVHWDER